MRPIKTAVAAALALSCAFVTFDATPALAGSLTIMDMLRGKKRDSEPLPGVAAPVLLPAETATQKPREVKPLPRVTGPTYYTYKADGLKRVAADKLTDPVVTGSVSSDGGTGSSPSGDAAIRAAFATVNVRAPAESVRAVEAFYRENKTLVWVDADGINDRARAVLAVLADAASVGLDPADYAIVMPQASDVADRDAGLAQFEVELSAAVATYALDATRGRVDPNRISGYHDFKRKDVNLVAALKNASISGDVAAYLESRSPRGSHFQALKAELARLKASGDVNDAITIAPGTLLKPGQSSPELANIVKGIVRHGSDALKTDHSLTIAGYTGTPEFTPELVSLVEAFQKEHGLKPDGVVGNASIRLLTGGDNVTAKIAKVEVAMEESRWLPPELGARYVMINQPAYKVYYHDNGAEQFSMGVVIGSKANQTYFFQDRIQTVEFNPYWGVPQSIIINEMLPKLRNDPNYLDRLGYEVAVGGRAVASSSIDWYGSTAGVSVRQPPSSDNALGELKILFPNSHAIYMHDTPSKSYFKRDMRALSHGCVRLADPRRMAAAVLGTTVEDVGAQISKGGNRAASVKADIPIYIAYFTAWPNKDGVVEYFDDVYGRDDYVRKAFTATRMAREAQG